MFTEVFPALLPYLHILAAVLVSARVILRRGLEPSTRLAWTLMVFSAPFIGIAIYILFGEIRLRRADKQRMADVRAHLTDLWRPSEATTQVEGQFGPTSAMITAAGSMQPVVGNRAELLAEDDSAFDALIAAIDAATNHVHLLFYIWLADQSGTRIAQAIIAAAQRGVCCRVVVDALGSRHMLRHDLWKQMGAAGVEQQQAFPLGNPFLRAFSGRLDVRNHRKIVVIDGKIGFTGSRNGADIAFLPKARYAPWVDIFFRIEGPVVRQMQAIFLQDWMSYTGTDLGHMLEDLPVTPPSGAIAQVLPSGPDWRQGLLVDSLVTLIHAARKTLTITTPYYIPNDPIEAAICSAAQRGVDVTVIFPKHNDSKLVAWVSEAYFEELLDAGVRLALFRDGLLHAKIITVDGKAAMIGSANLDRRSFDINYEMNLFWISPEITADLDARQQTYLARSDLVRVDEVRGWSRWRRARGNLAALATPLL